MSSLGASPRATAMRRIQVGSVGLIAVLVLVTLASMVVESSDNTQAGTTNMQVSQQNAVSGKKNEEPLAEIGLVPKIDADQDAQQKTKPKPFAAPSNTAPAGNSMPAQ